MVPTSPIEDEPPQEALMLRPMRRRTTSFSSSSSSSSSRDSFRSSSFSYNDDQFPPFSTPTTPLNFKGIPFSWEQLPGIPKHQSSNTKNSGHLLPPPPAGTTGTTGTTAAAKKICHQEEISPKKSKRFQRADPFYAALVECSKDGQDDHTSSFDNINHKGPMKLTRSLSDRFGLINMYTSCKRTCTISESIVYRPRQSPHYLLEPRSS